MKQAKHGQNGTLALTLVISAACGFGQARKDNSAPGRAGVNSSDQSKKDQDTSAPAREAESDGQTTLNLNSQACRLLPLADLQAQFGGEARVKSGLDLGKGESTCKFEVNKYVVSVQINPLDQSPFNTIEEGLASAKMMAEMSKGGMTIDETKNLGNVGCYSQKVELKEAPKGTPPGMSLPGPFTVCFQVQGGMVAVTVESPKEKTSLDVVKGLVEKAAARRK
jgi:hypothetical protein